jgi:hypothetical protein
MDRASELYTTGVPSPFNVVFAMYSDDVRQSEMLVHSELDHLRWSSDREFFRVELPEAIACVFDACKPTDQTVVQCDYAMDPGLINQYASKCGIAPPDVSYLLEFFTDNEWNAAAARFQQKIDARRNARNREVKDDIHDAR